MPSARSARGSFFPLDEELQLLPGELTPVLSERAAYANSLLPFDQAEALLERMLGVKLSPANLRRRTYAAGKAALEADARAMARLEAGIRTAHRGAGPALQQVSVDGAMIHTCEQGWREVKTLAIAEVVRGKDGPETIKPSYLSRLADHQTFIRTAALEFERRATEYARAVEAVFDGAEWHLQLVDAHCPSAVVILDFNHASGAVIEAAQAAFPPGTAAVGEWLGPQLHELRHGDPERVIIALGTLAEAVGEGSARAFILGRRDYLEKRRHQIHYASFSQAGYVIASGLVESAHKHVVQARLKGAGMRWAERHVDPLLALCCARRNERWDSTWAALSVILRERPCSRRRPKLAPPQPTTSAENPPPPALRPPTIVDGKPTDDHPWKSGLTRRTKS